MTKWKPPTQQAVQPIEYTIVYKTDEDGVYIFGIKSDERNPLLQEWVDKFGLTTDVLVENEGLPSERRTKILRLAELWGSFESDRAAWDERHALIDKAQCEAADLFTFVAGHFHGVTRLLEKGYSRSLLIEAMRVIKPIGNTDQAFADRMIAQGADRELMQMAVDATKDIPVRDPEDYENTDGWE
jgi:hypothetical protein